MPKTCLEDQRRVDVHADQEKPMQRFSYQGTAITALKNCPD